MNNPLLEKHPLPPFSDIAPQHVEPAVDALLADNRQRLRGLLEAGDRNWASLMRPLEDLNDRLHQAWSPVLASNR